MAMKKALIVLSGTVALMGGASTTAMAGHVNAPAGCSGVGQCETGADFLPAPRGHSGPMTVQSRTPYDYLDSIHFQRSPHVSITRVHGLLPSAGISDAPVGFVGTCHPQSTIYCRSNGQSAVNLPAPRPFVSNPVPHPQISTPPVHTNRVVAVGGGYDPSKFIPRTYGDPYTITPGIAHVPTSIVDRDPYRAQQVLDSGRAVYNPWTLGGVTPAFAGVPVNTTPVPPPLPPHYAPRGGYVGGGHVSSGYVSEHTVTSGSVSVVPPVQLAAPPVHLPAPAAVTCRHPGRYPAPGAHPVSPCAKKSRY